MAFSAKSRISEANQELAAMKILMTDTNLAIPLTPFSAAIEGAIVASKLLSGTIALKSGRTNDAIIDFTEAVNVEQKMIYNEPRDWLLNPKHWLGKAYLFANDGSNAEKTFKADLQTNNDNGWALYGLNKALMIQKKYNEAAPVLTRYKKAFSKADINILSPVYQ